MSCPPNRNPREKHSDTYLLSSIKQKKNASWPGDGYRGTTRWRGPRPTIYGGGPRKSGINAKGYSQNGLSRLGQLCLPRVNIFQDPRDGDADKTLSSYGRLRQDTPVAWKIIGKNPTGWTSST